VPMIIACLIASAFAAGAPSPGAAPLGSPDFRPSPAHPVGWRGDWTGRFPGASPPLHWSRRIEGSTTEIRYQADKPSGGPGPGSLALEYFTIKEWLVAGPYAAGEPASGIERDFLDGEERVEPARDARAGDSSWKPVRVGIETQSRHFHNEGTCGDLNVDFVYLFGELPESVAERKPEGLDNKVAYAHTYFYTPAAGPIFLRINSTAAAIKVFLNGRPVAIQPGQPVRIAPIEGWNRLLVKAASGQATAPEGQNSWVSHWRFAAYLEPVPPVRYQTRNIAWMTRMTGRSMSQPIVVGDRLYVGSGMTDLLCLDRKTGRVLWLRSNTPYDAMGDAERAALSSEAREKIEPLAARLAARDDEAVRAINAAAALTGLAPEEEARLEDALRAKAEAERAVHDAFAALARKKYPPMYRNEVSSSNATPVSDGERVYWACGGGMKGPGSHVIACFDLDGRRVWSWHDGGSLGSPEHGNHCSPNLIDGKLIYAANMALLALDAATGRELWRNSPDDWQNGGHGSNSPMLIHVGDQSAILQMRYLHRASDGTVICPSGLDVWGVLTPIVEGDVMYNPCRWRGWKDPVDFVAIRPPAVAGPGAKCQAVLSLSGKDATMPTRQPGAIFMVASPLYVDGIVYSVEMGGGLAAVDTAAGKALYRRYLDGYNRYHRFLYGIAASPALGGKSIFIIDDAGYTHLIEPGPRFEERGRNVLENIHAAGQGGNPGKQESFYTSPFFAGGDLYLRGEEYLYAIRE
jgi:outer membrane protein assembly factor BamB